MSVFGLLLAAGSSTRFAAGNKLFSTLPSGIAVWEASFRALATHPRIDAVGVVGSEAILERTHGLDCMFAIPGGTTRAESCRLGLESSPTGSLVLVHDAARPFVSPDLINSVIDAAIEHGAAIPATPVADTIKSVDNGRIESTLDRSRLYRAQTPQAGTREQLIRALDASPTATDEAAALEAIGVAVHVVAGDESNVKITTMADLPQGIARPSTGSGFDIHAFSSDPARRLMLGGIEFEGERGLAGHSDADVVLHALTDALLGAIGEGDIGLLFPNTDPAYANADSMDFLRVAVSKVAQAQGQIVSADITVLAEVPRLGDKREKIRERISQELRIPQRRVNIKATTMEGLGAIGRKEGVAAMATVTVLLQ